MKQTVAGLLSICVGVGFPAMAVAQSCETPTGQDISPSHWAYPAFQRLSQHYGCVGGYPAGTFRGDELIIRYEATSLLVACLDNVLSVIEQEQVTERQQHESLLQGLQELKDDVEGRTDALE